MTCADDFHGRKGNSNAVRKRSSKMAAQQTEDAMRKFEKMNISKEKLTQSTTQASSITSTLINIPPAKKEAYLPDVVPDYKTFSGQKIDHPLPDIKERLLTDLSFEQIDEIAAMLDCGNQGVTKNWHDLSMYLNLSEAERNALRRDGTGGGHPAHDFLIHLKSCNTTADLQGLITYCRKMQRNDIGNFLVEQIRPQGMSHQTKIYELPHDLTNTLAEKLTSNRGIIKDWKHLASYYGYDHSQIQQFCSRTSGHAHYSPTKALFEFLRGSRPEMQVGYLMDILGTQMTRYDVVRKIQSFA